MIFDPLSRRFRVYSIEWGGGCSRTYGVPATSERHQATDGFNCTWPRYEAREAKNPMGWTFVYQHGMSFLFVYVHSVLFYVFNCSWVSLRRLH